MAQLQEQIEAIFSLIFGLEQPLDIENLQRDQMAQWDSLAQVNLIAALESQFDLFIEIEEAKNLDSFRVVEKFVSSQMAASPD